MTERGSSRERFAGNDHLSPAITRHFTIWSRRWRLLSLCRRFASNGPLLGTPCRQIHIAVGLAARARGVSGWCDVACSSQAPYDFFAVCFMSFPVLVWLLDGATVERPARLLRRLRPAFAVGWWFGFGYFVAGLWWVGGAMLVEADEIRLGAADRSRACCRPSGGLLRSGCRTGAAFLDRRYRPHRLRLPRRSHCSNGSARSCFTGFPWNPIGYAAMPMPLLMQSVSVVGMFGMNALAVLRVLDAGAACRLPQRPRRPGACRAARRRACRLRLFQARPAGRAAGPHACRFASSSRRSIRPPSSTESSRDEIFRTLARRCPPRRWLPIGAKPKLIVWPETSLPFLLTDRPDALVAIGEILCDGQVLLAGNVRAEGQGKDA